MISNSSFISNPFRIEKERGSAKLVSTRDPPATNSTCAGRWTCNRILNTGRTKSSRPSGAASAVMLAITRRDRYARTNESMLSILFSFYINLCYNRCSSCCQCNGEMF